MHDTFPTGKAMQMCLLGRLGKVVDYAMPSLMTGVQIDVSSKRCTGFNTA